MGRAVQLLKARDFDYFINDPFEINCTGLTNPDFMVYFVRCQQSFLLCEPEGQFHSIYYSGKHNLDDIRWFYGVHFEGGDA
jgi:hypothetical protein